jgi:hypothetical protein
MEAVSYLAGEPWSDHPACASPVISGFLRKWNDDLSHEDRNRLLPQLIPIIIGTSRNESSERLRSDMAVEWFFREFVHDWLYIAGNVTLANRARTICNIRNLSWREVEDLIISARYNVFITEMSDIDNIAKYQLSRTYCHSSAGPAAMVASAYVSSEGLDCALSDLYNISENAAFSVNNKKLLGKTIHNLQLSALDLVRRMIAVRDGGS